MMDITKWFGLHIRLATFLMMLLFFCSCKSKQMILPPDSTEIELTERLVPVPSRPVDINAQAYIDIDNKGVPYFIHPPIINDNRGANSSKPKVDISITDDGKLNVDISVPPDTTYYPVYDKTTSTTKTILVDKELSAWQQFCIRFVKLLIMVVLLYGGFKLYKIFHLR